MATSSYSLNTLEQGQFLNYSQQLVSPNRRFTLGFFNHSEVPENIYLAIWFSDGIRETSPDHPVWIANRNKPFQNKSAVLSLDLEGNTSKLIIRSNRSDTIELYSGPTNSNVTAALLNSGNFVLYGPEEAVLWQSFDHPTDTLLPGMKLGLNHRTGKNWTLTSWFDDSRPSDGAFSVEWDPIRPRLVVKRRGVIYWASGNARDKPFEFIETDSSNLNYHFIKVSNDSEEYFSYGLNHTAPSFVNNRNYISGWIMNYDGLVLDQGRGFPISLVIDCYGYKNWTARDLRGCQLWEQPKCRHPYQKFELRAGGFRNPEGDFNSGFLMDNSSLSISDCREICWKNCDCVAYRYYSNDGCVFWRGSTHVTFEQDLSGTFAGRVYRLISNPPQEKENKWIWGVIAAAIVSFTCFLITILCIQRRKKMQEKKIKLLQLMTLDGYTDTVELANNWNKGKDIKDFSYQCISAATNGFASENKLGEGGFGPVYKGKLSGAKSSSEATINYVKTRFARVQNRVGSYSQASTQESC